jgi:hypothetical protein
MVLPFDPGKQVTFESVQGWTMAEFALMKGARVWIWRTSASRGVHNRAAAV